MVTNEEIQAALDRHCEQNAGYQVRASDAKVMQICDWDLPNAEEQLQRWAARHPNDSHVVGMNPLQVKIYATFRPDAENPTLFQKRKQRKIHAAAKQDERRQWDSMNFERPRK